VLLIVFAFLLPEPLYGIYRDILSLETGWDKETSNLALPALNIALYTFFTGL